MRLGEGTEKSFSEIVAPFRVALNRYWRFCIAPAFAIAAIVLLLSVALPSYYSADVLIQIQGQKLSEGIIEAKRGNKDENEEMHDKLDSLMQELLSRPRVREVIERFDLYPDLSGIKGKEKAVKKFRDNTVVAQEKSPTGRPLSNAFRLSFSHNSPNTAYEVAKSLSQLFIDKSILEQRNQVESERRFLNVEIEKAKKELEEIEAKLQVFIKKNIGKLPEQTQQALARLDAAQRQIETNTVLMTANREEKRLLQQELKIPTAVGAGGVSGLDVTDPYTQLTQLKAALRILKGKYSEEHPDVQGVRAKIRGLEQQLSGKGKKKGSSAVVSGSPATRQIRLAINDLDVTYKRLQDENEKLKKTVSDREKDINQMPETEQQLVKIRRDYNNLTNNYQSLLARRDIVERKGEAVRTLKDSQFRVTDPAAVPAIPSGPPRLIIGSAGIGAGFVSFFILPMMLFFMNSTYKFRDEIEKELGITVLTVVPPMSTAEVKKRRRRAYISSIVLSVLAFIILSAVVILLV